ncbi:MAG: glycosyltransferase [Roseburia hominis]
MSIYEKKLSIVIPAYNEGERIYENLLEMSKLLSSFVTDYEMIVVNDGSKDNTEGEIRRASETVKNIVSAGYQMNRGKGGAIKEGVKCATGDYIAFLDADMDLSPMHLKDFLAKMEETSATAVIGSKMHKDSKVNYPLPRKIMSLGYFLLLKMLFRLNIKDTQTGVKLFEADALKKVMRQVSTDGFAYDIEILALICASGGTIVEMPIELIFQRTNGWGRIRLSDVMEVAQDTMKIYHNVHRIKKKGNGYEGI